MTEIDSNLAGCSKCKPSAPTMEHAPLTHTQAIVYAEAPGVHAYPVLNNDARNPVPSSAMLTAEKYGQFQYRLIQSPVLQPQAVSNAEAPGVYAYLVHNNDARNPVPSSAMLTPEKYGQFQYRLIQSPVLQSQAVVQQSGGVHNFGLDLVTTECPSCRATITQTIEISRLASRGVKSRNYCLCLYIWLLIIGGCCLIIFWAVWYGL